MCAVGLGRNKPVAKSERCRLFLFDFSFASSFILKLVREFLEIQTYALFCEKCLKFI